MSASDAGGMVAAYEIETYLEPERAAEVLAGEQSAGTFTKVALETDELKREHGATVVSIHELEPSDRPPLPGSWRPDGRPAVPRRARVEIAFPVQNFGTSLPALLTTVAGNLFELRELAAVRLLDFEVPEALGAAYAGPQFGVDGTRRLMGDPAGVLVGMIIKPSVGLGLDELRGVVRDLAGARIDFIKDDELLADPPYAPLAERVPVVMEEIDRAVEHTGRKTMYAFNLTGDLDDMLRHHDLVAEAGGTCVMVAVPVVGLGALEFLRRRSSLPIHGHRALFGALSRSPQLGIDFTAYQKAARLAGADHLHVGGVDSKFYEANDSVFASIGAVGTPLPGTAPALPVLSSAQWAGTAPATWAGAGTTDLLVLSGGGIHGHPGGTFAGVESMREAWQVAAAGEPLESRAARSPALREALEAFGR